VLDARSGERRDPATFSATRAPVSPSVIPRARVRTERPANAEVDA
jgi:hypothetical protein